MDKEAFFRAAKRSPRRGLRRLFWQAVSATVLVFLLLLGARTALLQESAQKPGAAAIAVSGRINLPDGKDVVRGQPFMVEVIISAKGADPQLNAEPPRINWPKGLQVLAGSGRQESRVTEVDGVRFVEQAYIYRATPETDEDSVSLGAFSINYWIRGAEEAKTLVIPGVVMNVVDSKRAKRSVKFWLLLGTVDLVIFAVVLAFVVTFYQRRKKKEDRVSSEPSGQPTEESSEGRFLRNLAASQKFLIAGEPKKFYAAMEKHVKDFMEMKYEVSIGNNSQRNIDSLVNEGMNPKRAAKLISLLERCQEVRFSPQEPSPPENNRFQREIEEVVRASAPRRSTATPR